MKPVLVIPPAPSRWPALEALLGHVGSPWIDDLKRRFAEGVAGSEDAFGLIAPGGQILANAAISKRGPVGVVGHCYTHPDHRRRGYARQVVETVTAWFEMTGGQWLFLATTTEYDEGFYRKFGFTPLRQAVWRPHDRVTLWWRKTGAADDPLAAASGAAIVRDLTRADWATMIALLQFRSGPDPRVPLDESAVTAEVFTLDLIDHLERGACQLKGAFSGDILVGFASVATDRRGDRTYALLVPHDGTPPELRDAAISTARAQGYQHVDFPMEQLGQVVANGLERPGAAE